MKAVAAFKSLPITDINSLVDIELPIPEPGPFDVLVQVEAVSVNSADYRVRLRKEDDGTCAVLGWDAAGTVVSIGANVSSEFKAGDAVYYAGDLLISG
jgi:NADPH:quinone reductase-like Zn-dependent oxidoreductase